MKQVANRITFASSPAPQNPPPPIAAPKYEPVKKDGPRPPETR
jgi:hypothetical protein